MLQAWLSPEMQTILAHPLLKGAISGLVTAAAIDYDAFRSWKSFKDACSYDWATASFRWMKGVVVGVVLAFGYGQVVG